ncbi:hypothetical protein G6683_07395 [Polynucleobacter paneuropaeus]|nr:hypothetical protein [Polynucleobacter paneuropaeus]
MNEIQSPLPIELKVKKSRGGQQKTSLAIARAKLWCLEVKERTALPYKTLDEMFLGKDPEEVFFEPPKAFEKIWRRGIYPRDARHRRGLEDLVEAVEAHPDCLGTSIVFNSRLWDLFELNSISEAEMLKRIDEVFLDHQVKRHPLPQIESWRYGRNPEIDVQHPVSPLEMLGLQAANLNKITWMYLTILFYFFVKTTIAARSERVLKLHTDALRDYFEERLGDFGQECFLVALKSIQNVQVIRVFEAP